MARVWLCLAPDSECHRTDPASRQSAERMEFDGRSFGRKPSPAGGPEARSTEYRAYLNASTKTLPNEKRGGRPILAPGPSGVRQPPGDSTSDFPQRSRLSICRRSCRDLPRATTGRLQRSLLQSMHSWPLSLRTAPPLIGVQLISSISNPASLLIRLALMGSCTSG
jgi:hypothetical protein